MDFKKFIGPTDLGQIAASFPLVLGYVLEFSAAKDLELSNQDRVHLSAIRHENQEDFWRAWSCPVMGEVRRHPERPAPPFAHPA
jgi:hypothetical protein